MLASINRDSTIDLGSKLESPVDGVEGCLLFSVVRMWLAHIAVARLLPLALLILASSAGSAFALSASCQAVNIDFGGGVTVRAGEAEVYKIYDQFDTGDVVTYSVTTQNGVPAELDGTIGSANFRILMDNGTLVEAIPANGQEINLVNQTTPPLDAGVTYYFDAVGSGHATGDVSVSATCAAAAVPITLSPSGSTLSATGGTAFSQSFSASGGNGTFTYALTGTLPTGLSFNAGSATLSGIPAQSGSFSISVKATDGLAAEFARSYTLNVAAPTIGLTPSFLATQPQRGISYSQQLSATGGTTPYAYQVTSGSLPAGLSLSSSSGVLSGVPTTAGAYNFTVTAIDGLEFSGSRTYSGTVGAGPPIAASSTATVGYRSASNLIVGSLSGGTPTSVTIVGAAYHGTVTVSGTSFLYTPTSGYYGSDSFSYTANNGVGSSLAATITITVGTPTLNFSTNVPQGRIGEAYTHTLVPSGGASPYTFIVSSGALPNGLALSSDGTISGTPTAAGTFNFGVTLTDSSTPTPVSITASSLSITVQHAISAPWAPIMAGATAGDGQASVSFIAPIFDGGFAITGYRVTSTPDNISVQGTTSPIAVPGLSNGTSYTFVVEAENSIGFGTPSVASTAVTPGTVPDAPIIDTVIGGNGQASVAFNAPQSNGGVPITRYQVTSSPDGISAYGTRSPIVVAGLSNGTAYTFVVAAENNFGFGSPSSASVSVTPDVAALAFTPDSGALEPAMAGEGYTQPIAATGGTGTVIYDLAAGALPPGVVLNRSTGTLSGTVDGNAALGNYSFTISAVDGIGGRGSSAYGLEIVARSVLATNKSIVITPGSTPLPVDLTNGATGGPFTSATVGAVSPPQAGTAEVTMGDVAAIGTIYPTTFYLKFHPNPEFSGTAVVGYTLVSVLGTSNSATVSFTSALDVAAVGERFDSLVHGFVQTRQSLLANEIKVPGLLERRRAGGLDSPGSIDIAPNGNSVTMNFASSLADLNAWNQAGDAATALAFADAPNPFNAWIDGTVTVHLKSADGGEHWGKFGLVSVGADYLVNDKLLVGLALHMNGMDDLTSTSNANGTGLFAGPYVSTEIGDGVFLDADLLYGRTWNEVSTKIFNGKFETEQLLAHGKLSGQWKLDDSLTFRPEASVFYLHEAIGGYTVSNALGEAVILSGFSTDQLRFGIGGTLEYALTYGDNLLLTPYLGTTLGLSSTNGANPLEGSFGTLSGGFTLSGEAAWLLNLNAELGLEASGLKSASSRAGLRVSF